MEGVGVRVPGSAAEAEQMALRGLSFLVADCPAELGSAGQAERLKVLEQICRRASAAQAPCRPPATAPPSPRTSATEQRPSRHGPDN